MKNLVFFGPLIFAKKWHMPLPELIRKQVDAKLEAHRTIKVPPCLCDRLLITYKVRGNSVTCFCCGSNRGHSGPCCHLD